MHLPCFESPHCLFPISQKSFEIQLISCTKTTSECKIHFTGFHITYCDSSPPFFSHFEPYLIQEIGIDVDVDNFKYILILEVQFCF